MTSPQNPALVVVSHYDAWPTADLERLVSQMSAIDAGMPFDLCIVVNSEIGKKINSIGGAKVLYRPNTGYNIGAWQYGWEQNPGYEFYLFLQDECVIRKPGWLRAFRDVANISGVGLVGESIVYHNSWSEYEKYRGFYETCRDICQDIGISLGNNPTHLQSLVIGARGDALKAIGGFVLTSGGKIEAIATEVLTSIRARALGYRIAQVSWRPFEYIYHPQWASLREQSSRLSWTMSKIFYEYLPEQFNYKLRRIMKRDNASKASSASR
ncbi:MAG: hypothetical protein U1E46_15955 [Hyphomicrobiales bacterium]